MSKTPKPTTLSQEKIQRLSEHVSTIAHFLSLMLDFARRGTPMEGSLCVLVMIRELGECALAITREGDVFSVEGDVDDTVKALGSTYANAHVAVVHAAIRFVHDLLTRIDGEAYAKRRESASNASNSDPSENAFGPNEFCAVLEAATSDWHIVAREWELARGVIFDLLPANWEQEFPAVKARVQRERVAALLPLNDINDKKNTQFDSSDNIEKKVPPSSVVEVGNYIVNKQGEIKAGLKTKANREELIAQFYDCDVSDPRVSAMLRHLAPDRYGWYFPFLDRRQVSDK